MPILNSPTPMWRKPWVVYVCGIACVCGNAVWVTGSAAPALALGGFGLIVLSFAMVLIKRTGPSLEAPDPPMPRPNDY